MSLDRLPLALALGTLLVGGALAAVLIAASPGGLPTGSSWSSSSGELVAAQNDTNETNETNDSYESNDSGTYNGSEESDTNSSGEDDSMNESEPEPDEPPPEDLEPTAEDGGAEGSSIGLAVAVVVFVVAAAGLLLWSRT